MNPAISSQHSAVSRQQSAVSYQLCFRNGVWFVRPPPCNMAHPDLDQLWNSIVPVAQMLLTKQGEFLPIGAIMLSDGVIRHVAGKIEGDEYPGSQSLLDLLTDTFRTEAAKGKLRAAVICYDVLTIPPGKDRKQDAICCGLEHCLGESVNVFTPYIKTEDGGFRYEGVFCAKREPQFFFKMPRA